jgi:PAS domain S-box-containing protein
MTEQQSLPVGILSQADFQRSLELIPVAVIAIGPAGTIIYFNHKSKKDLGFSKTQLNRSVVQFFRQLSLHPITLADLLRHEKSGEQEFILLTPAGPEKRVLISSLQLQGPENKSCTYLFVKDVTGLQKKEDLFSYLNTAAEELAQARDAASALEKISNLIVPIFANWFSIDLLKNDQLEHLVLAHENADKIAWAKKYRKAYPTDLNSDSGTARVLKTGIPIFVPVITGEMLIAGIKDPEQLSAIQEMDLRSVITVAMFNQERITGSVTFISTTPGRHYDETDLRFAQNFANHVGMALENARLNDAATVEIARRKEVEKQLRTTQANLQTALSSGLVGTWTLDLKTYRLYADDTLARMFGVPFTPEGYDQEVFSSKIHPEDRQLIDRKRMDSIAQNENYETEYRVINDGAIRWFFARGQTDPDESGQPVTFTGVVVDVTERKAAEIALKESEERYSAAFENASVGILLVDLNGTLIQANSAFLRITGYQPADLTDMTFRTITHPDDLPRNIELYRQLFAQEIEDFVIEKRYYHQSGHIIWVRTSTSLVHDVNGKPGYAICIVEDITHQKLAQIELRENEELFRFLTDVIPHKLWTSAPDGTATYYNQGWYDYTGCTSFEELKANVWNVLHPEDKAAAVIEWPKAMQKGRDIEMESRFRRHDGEYRWHLTRVSAHRDHTGQIKLWVGTSTDIHEQKVIQEALMSSEAHFKTLTQLNSLPIWQIDADCNMIFVNDAWRIYSGISSLAIQESDWTGNIHPDDRDTTVREFNHLCKEREPINLKYRFFHQPSGEFHWMLDNAQPIFNPEFAGYIGTMTDIDEQEKARLAIQDLMRKKDEFISIASHELKTPLTTVKAYMQLVNREMLTQGKLGELVHKADRQLNRLERLITDLLDVSRITAGKLAYNIAGFKISEVIRDAVGAVNETTKSHEILISSLPDVDIQGDRDRIEQVVVNLLTNAVKYSPGADRVIVSAVLQQSALVVSVEDFGIGIEAAEVNRLFERFYRVEEVAARFNGLGLGLFISAEIIRRHGGTFQVTSSPSKGSVFSFSLPLTSG